MDLAEHLPPHLHAPHQKLQDSVDQGARHKIVLELGEALVIYLVGILFGEYKRSGLTNMDLEARFYAFSRKKPSFGNFIEFYRMLTKILPESILSGKFAKNDYSALSEFDLNWGLLKQVIDQGADADFATKVEERKRGRTPGRKNMQEFFNVLVEVRNIYAHPEEKAGPKDNPRKWPVGDEYFTFINPLVEQALLELMTDLDVLTRLRPARPERIDEVNRNVVFSVEQGGTQASVQVELLPDELKGLSSDLRYLLDLNDRIYAQLYYHTVPPLNQQVAREVIEREKSKMIEPHLKQMIRDKLAGDARIDEMGLLVLKDTAKSGFISEETLYSLINEACAALALDVRAGTPDLPGDVFIQTSISRTVHRFNPWWLYYFSMVTKVDRQIVAGEKKDQKEYQSKIRELESSRKDLPIHRKIEREAERAKELRKKRKAIEKELKKATGADLETLRLRLEDLDRQLAESEQAEGGLREILAGKTAEIDGKLERLKQELEALGSHHIWSIHRNTWNVLDQYVGTLVGKSLNRSGDEAEGRWINDTNAWQIGALSYTYWAKVFPETAPLQNIFHVGFVVSNQFKWFPEQTDPAFRELIKQPLSLMWTTWDTKRLEKVDIDGLLVLKLQEINTAVVHKYAEQLQKMGTMLGVVLTDHKNSSADSIDRLVSVPTYFAEQDGLIVREIYSRIWTINDFIKEGLFDLAAVDQFDREMAWYLQIFANVIGQLNDYALEIGINEEVINQREDQFRRHKDVLFAEFAKLHVAGAEFKPEKAQLDAVRHLATDTLGLNDYLFENILSAYRFSVHTKKSKPGEAEDKEDNPA